MRRSAVRIRSQAPGQRPFLKLSGKGCPDPGYGLTIDVPLFNSASTVGQQVAENSGVTNTSPSGQYVTANLVTLAGEVARPGSCRHGAISPAKVG